MQAKRQWCHHTIKAAESFSDHNDDDHYINGQRGAGKNFTLDCKLFVQEMLFVQYIYIVEKERHKILDGGGCYQQKANILSLSLSLSLLYIWYA